MKRENSKYARGDCARSGKEMLLKDMVEDGYYPGTYVDPFWYEGPHPQERFVPAYDDPNIDQPSPRNNQSNTTVRWPAWDDDNLVPVQDAVGYFNVEDVTVVIS